MLLDFEYSKIDKFIDFMLWVIEVYRKVEQLLFLIPKVFQSLFLFPLNSK
jgi:hypothetical protein